MAAPPIPTDAVVSEKDHVNDRTESDVGQEEKNIEWERKPELTWRAGLACAGASLSYFATVGFLNAAGVFVEYYTSTFLQGTTNFQISWLSSFALFIVFAFAAPAGLLADKFGPTIPIVCGSIIELVALFMISLCKQYYQFFLAQGFLLGIGMSFIAIPASGMVPRYFNRHRGIASGISVAGSSLGGVIWPIVMDQLLYKHKLSFGWSMRIVGFIMIPLLGAVVLTVRLPREEGDKAGEEKSPAELQEARRQHRAVLKKRPFVLLCAGLFFYYLAFFTPFLFISTYAVKLGMSHRLAFYTVSVVNAASFWGRVLPGFIADRVGRFNVLFVSSFFAAIVGFCWTAATSPAGVFVWIAGYGFASGAIMSLQIACATSLVHESISSSAIGIAMGSTSFAGLFGAPIAGQLTERGYLSLAMFTGAMLLAGTVLTAASRLSQNRKLWAAV